MRWILILVLMVSVAFADDTPTPSPSDTPTSPTATATASDTPSPTASLTASPTASDTPSPTASLTASPTASDTPSPTASDTPSPTASPVPSPTQGTSKRAQVAGSDVTASGPPRVVLANADNAVTSSAETYITVNKSTVGLIVSTDQPIRLTVNGDVATTTHGIYISATVPFVCDNIKVTSIRIKAVSTTANVNVVQTGYWAPGQ